MQRKNRRLKRFPAFCLVGVLASCLLATQACIFPYKENETAPVEEQFQFLNPEKQLFSCLSSEIAKSRGKQTSIDRFQSDVNWPCLKRESFLRDNKGRPLWFDSDTMQMLAIKRTPLRAPALLGKNNLYGQVTIQLLIGKDGKVRCLRGAEGNPMAVASAIHSVSKWVFKPHLVNGEATSIIGWITLSYDFRN